MLTEEERRQIEAVLEHYEYKQAACIEALKILQLQRGWISDQSIQDLAPILEMSPDELDNVATFYTLIFRKPVGKHVILLCDSVSCWIMGYERIRDRLSASLGIQFGETSADGAFTLLPNPCLGACDHAPTMMIGEELYQDLDVDSVDQIIDRYRHSVDA